MVKVTVIAFIHHSGVQDTLQIAQIHDVPGLGIRRTPHRDLEDVIMPVPVRIGAQAVVSNIPFLTLGRIVQPMR